MSDLISREAAVDAVRRSEALDRAFGYGHAVDALRELPSAQPDLSEYSDKLWKKAYERGKAEAQQRWIPCSERLPEPRVAVLGYAPKFKNIFALYYDSVMGWMVWSPIRDDCLPNSQGDIIAWMPLPEPYAERRTDEHTD